MTTFNVLKFDKQLKSDEELSKVLISHKYSDEFVFKGFAMAAVGVEESGRVLYDEDLFWDIAYEEEKKNYNEDSDYVDDNITASILEYVTDTTRPMPNEHMPIFVVQYEYDDDITLSELSRVYATDEDFDDADNVEFVVKSHVA